MRADYRWADGKKRIEEIFHAPAHCPEPCGQVQFSQWQADIESRIATARAKQRGDGRDLTQKQAHAPAGKWYRWLVGQPEENPGNPNRCDSLCRTLRHLLIDVAGDPETGEIDIEAPEVREEIHSRLADQARTAQFLANNSEIP